MSNWIGPTVKQLWNYALHLLHNFFGFNPNTTAFCLGQSSLHLLLLKSSMVYHLSTLLCYCKISSIVCVSNCEWKYLYAFEKYIGHVSFTQVSESQRQVSNLYNFVQIHFRCYFAASSGDLGGSLSLSSSSPSSLCHIFLCLCTK